MEPKRWTYDELTAATARRRSAYRRTMLRWAAIGAAMVFVASYILTFAIAHEVVRKAFIVSPRFPAEYILGKLPAVLLLSGLFGAMPGAGIGIVVEWVRHRRGHNQP